MADLAAEFTLSSKEAEAVKGVPSNLRFGSTDVELADLYSIDKNIALLDGLEFDQLIVRRQGDHFLAMVKATKGKKPYIAYVASQTYADTLQTVASFASKGVLTWKEDIYPSKRVRSR